MLKSTYKPAAEASLPPGWTEHQAPTGHTYYYNAATGESTYKRPTAPAPVPAILPPVRLSDPRAANAFMAQMNPERGSDRTRGGRGGRGGGSGRPIPQPTDKPKSKVEIPGCEPWVLVYTKYGRRFAYNPVKKASYWRIPERLKEGILELDKARIREKAGVGSAKGGSAEGGSAEGDVSAKGDDTSAAKDGGASSADGDASAVKGDAASDPDQDSEYEEIEVTDDEDENPSKRQKTEEPAEFGEDDIAFQLQAMGDEYGLEPGDYDDGNMDSWPEGTAGAETSDEDARTVFKSLLDDFISPYSPWDKLLEEGKVMDDARYTVLGTMRERKEVWEEWSRERIRTHKEQRAREEKKDPRVAFMAFLQDNANPKLYWPEFRRKHRKEATMRDAALSDKDREKWYREHVARLKLPEAKRKADLTALLKAQPASVLSRRTDMGNLPVQLTTDVRFISLPVETRDALVEAYIQSLPVVADE
ncbi:DNA replication protein 4 [Magnaporthiopsis poae ATCC 64411]|uniref:DNA replication protein 4 n=1 Tax=Magnaporthiopsis poae (strain ATCC 64411 / 73-15) TaxID=644358 RepID=A0A0C4DXY4_MAGP6|nr:DNA replication protein 4 [Magnaporthiopsis poae ATCC 64411]